MVIHGTIVILTGLCPIDRLGILTSDFNSSYEFEEKENTAFQLMS